MQKVFKVLPTWRNALQEKWSRCWWTASSSRLAWPASSTSRGSFSTALSVKPSRWRKDVMNNIQGDWNLPPGWNADFCYPKSFSGCWQACSWLYAGICFCFSTLGWFCSKRSYSWYFSFFWWKGFCLRQPDAEQDELCGAANMAFHCWDSQVTRAELHEMWTLSIWGVYVLVWVKFDLREALKKRDKI